MKKLLSLLLVAIMLLTLAASTAVTSFAANSTNYDKLANYVVQNGVLSSAGDVYTMVIVQDDEYLIAIQWDIADEILMLSGRYDNGESVTTAIIMPTRGSSMHEAVMYFKDLADPSTEDICLSYIDGSIFSNDNQTLNSFTYYSGNNAEYADDYEDLMEVMVNLILIVTTDYLDAASLGVSMNDLGFVNYGSTSAKLGDINKDSKVNQYDYILAKRIHFKNYTPTAEQKVLGDVDKDGDNDQYDYILIKRHHFGTYTIGSAPSTTPDSGTKPDNGEAYKGIVDYIRKNGQLDSQGETHYLHYRVDGDNGYVVTRIACYVDTGKLEITYERVIKGGGITFTTISVSDTSNTHKVTYLCSGIVNSSSLDSTKGEINGATFSANNKEILSYSYSGSYSNLSSDFKDLMGIDINDALVSSAAQIKAMNIGVDISDLGFANY